MTQPIDNPAQTETATQVVLTDSTPPFGAEFALARKKKQWSLEQVASELNILKRHVVAIEEEDYNALPPKAFARGFIINYARLLGLDSDEMVRRFEAGHPVKEEVIKPLQKIGNTVERGGSRRLRLNFALIAGILALLLLAVAILKMVSTAKTATKTDTVVVTDTLSQAEQAQGAAVGSSGSALSATGSALSSEVTTNGIIDFWVKEPTQILVTDAKGATLMDGNQNRGGYQITGQTPFSVTITDPDKVDVSFNHQKVDTAAHTSGNTATLTLQ